jgi:hypothetical protein
MRIISVLLLIAPILTAAGCTTTNLKGAPIDAVINDLKAQLKEVPPLDVTYDGDKGCEPNGKYRVVAFPTKASVQLKTVLTDTNTAGLGATFGTPVVVSPSFSHISTSVKTAQTTVAFCAIPETLESAKTPLSPEADCTWKLKTAKEQANYVKTLWPSLKETPLQIGGGNRNTLVEISQKTMPAEPRLKDIFDASIRGIAYSKHAGACLQPQSIDVQVAFEVAAENDAGFKLVFGIFNLSDTKTSKNDFTNTLEVTFELDKGSTPAAVAAAEATP